MIKNLKKLRGSKKISQKQLADIVSVSQQSINKYENHSIEPDIQTLMKLADYFNTSIDYLVGYTDIDHKIEELTPSDLNEEKQRIISKYRQLTPDEKKSIILILENYTKH